METRESRLPAWAAWALAMLISGTAAGALESGYLRDPSLHGERVFFTAEGDLWSAPLGGGGAQRLTRHPAAEAQVAVSPDGEQLAFAASYDGPVEAYVMPVVGGMPRRVSFDGAQVDVLGWSPDGLVLYASRARGGPSQRRVVRMVNPETLKTTTLPVLDANQASVDPETGSVVFTRFGLRVTGDHVRSYRGGAMAQLWRLDSSPTEQAVRLLADLGANATDPMWWGGRIYFVSDKSGVANLWSMLRDGSDLAQHTHHDTWAVREPALHAGRVVYQLGADLRLFEIANGTDRLIPIQLVGDFDLRRERWLSSPLDYLESAVVSPRGDRVALTVRGRAALAGLGPLRRVELASSGSNRVRAAAPGAEGRWVYAISDASGYNEIWRFPAGGQEEAEQLTTDGSAHRWRLYPSPDGRYLAHDDKNGNLWLLELATGENRRLHSAGRGLDDAYGPPAWSVDGKWIAFARPGGPREVNQIVLRSLADERSMVLTSDRYESFSPTFSPDGEWLYFLSNRNFEPFPAGPWGDRNVGPAFDRRAMIYALALQVGNRFPFQSQDELALKNAAQHGDKEDAGEEAGEDEVPAIELDGLAQRLFEVPAPPGNYSLLNSAEGRLLLLDQAAATDATPSLRTIEVTDESPELETFMDGVESYALAGEGQKLFVTKAGKAKEMFLLDVADKAPEDLAVARVRVDDWRLPVTPREEWRQMFLDAWRMHRDFSFDPDMRGVDWDAVRARFEPLVARVTDRWELDDLLGEMISELGILHSQVGRADLPADLEAPLPAFLGAEFEPTEKGLEITHIYRSDPELPSERAPLQRPGVDAAVGDVLSAVNGRRVESRNDLVDALANQAGQQVLLDLRRGNRAHQAVVTPVDALAEAMSRYKDWVHQSGDAVLQASGGRIGYLHLRAMGGSDMATFAREFYANYDREGLIIDVRGNRGGNIDSWVIEKLLRRAWAFWRPPGGGEPYTNMQAAFRGHLAVLVDQFTYSDGETFAAGIKALDLAPLIGTTTAGAGIWLSDRNSLSDRGIARIAEYPQFGLDGRWLIEGHGIAPDIEVDNSPSAAYRGQDQQLEAAIEYLQEKLAGSPIPQLEGQETFALDEPGSDVD
jgi:tricorn protease